MKFQWGIFLAHKFSCLRQDHDNNEYNEFLVDGSSTPVSIHIYRLVQKGIIQTTLMIQWQINICNAGLGLSFGRLLARAISTSIAFVHQHLVELWIKLHFITIHQKPLQYQCWFNESLIGDNLQLDITYMVPDCEIWDLRPRNRIKIHRSKEKKTWSFH